MEPKSKVVCKQKQRQPFYNQTNFSKQVNLKKEKRFFNVQYNKISKKLKKQENHKIKIQGKINSSLPVLQVSLGNSQLKVKCLVDSGCTNVVCNKALYDQLKQTKNATKISPWLGSIIAANGQPIKVLGTTEFKIKIQHFSWRVRALVLANLNYSLVLGCDFISQTQMVLDLSAQNCYFKFCTNIKVPLVLRPFNHGNCNNLRVGCEEARNDVEKLVKKYSNVFSGKIGKALNYEHTLSVTDNEPVKIRPYYTSPPTTEKMKAIINEWEKQGIVEPSISAYSSPCFLTKNDRLVVNYSKINTKLVKNHFPLGDLQNMYAHLKDASIYSVVDLKNSFLQVPLSPESRDFTTFSTYWGSFRFLRIPFGLHCGSSVLSSYLDKLFKHLKFKTLLTFAEDLLIFSKSLPEHLKHLEEVLEILDKNNLTANLQKASFCTTKVSFLGNVISNNKISIDPDRTVAIRNFKTPTTARQVSQFLGAVNFFSKFLNGYASLAQPLNELRKKRVKFVWTKQCEESFQKLKDIITSPPVLQIPDCSRPFTLMCDSSAVACGSCLLQEVDGELLPIAYHSKKYTNQELRYSIFEKEAYSCIIAIEKYYSYLEVMPFKLITDNQALSFILSTKKHFGRLGRWVERLLALPFTVEHRPGKENTVADTLSRLESDNVTGETEEDVNFDIVEEARARGIPFPFSPHENGLALTPPHSPRPPQHTTGSISADPNVNKPLPSGSTAILSTNVLNGKKYKKGSNCKQNREENQYLNNLISELPLAFEDLVKHQNKDEECQKIILSIKNGTNHKGYFLKNNLLMFKNPNQTKGRIFLPQNLDSLIYTFMHESILGGHLGEFKTVSRVFQYFYRPDLKSVIKNKVKSCLLCKMSKSAQRTYRGKLISSYSETPMDKLFTDILGPLTLSKNKNMYVLVTVDHHSRYVWLSALKSCTSKNIIDSLVRDIFKNFSVCRKLVSDNAQYFRSHLFKKFLFQNYIQHYRIAPYSPCANLSERFIKQVITCLRTYFHDKQEFWDVNLSEIQSALNTATSESTKDTPHNLMFKHPHNTPLSNLWQLNDLVGEKLTPDQIKANLAKAISNIKRSQKLNQQRTRYDPQHARNPFRLDSLVLLKTHYQSNKGLRFSAKLAPKYSGLYRIVHFITSNTCLVQDTKCLTKIFKAHIAEMKLYR